MAINPKERISHEELLDYVSINDFMNENIIYINNQKEKYEKIFNEIEIIKKTGKQAKSLKEKDPSSHKKISDKRQQYKDNLEKK